MTKAQPRPTLLIGLLLILLAPLASTAHAAGPLAETELQPGGLVLHPRMEAVGYTLTVSLPDGTVVRREFTASQTPSFLFQDEPGEVADGTYTYQLTATPVVSSDLRVTLRALQHDPERGSIALPTLPTLSGYFTVVDGAVAANSNSEADGAGSAQDASSSGGLQALPAADQLFIDDIIIIANECVGTACVNGESFGTDNLRLKDVNNRIHFLDTSIGAFPSNDWRILANSDVSGGGNFFAIEDDTANRQVFTVEAGARANALYVDDAGRVGLGTATPVEDLHFQSGDTPTLRLEQDGSSSFTPQTWDIGGNEANFFLRDTTAGSNVYPFRVRPGAPTSSIDVAGSGNVGLGTASPSAALHLFRSNGSAKGLIQEASGTSSNRVLLELRNNGGVGMDFNNIGSGVVWTTRNIAGNFQIRENSDSTNEFVLDASGNLTLSGTITVPGGTLPDYVFESDYPLMPLDDLAAFIAEHKHLPNVPSAQAVQDAGKLDLTDFQRRLLEKIEELTLYTLDQEKRLTRVDRLEAENRDLRMRLEALERAGERAP